MIRTFSIVGLAVLLGAGTASAQMKHVDLKDAKGNSVGMAMISPARGGGVSIDLDLKGLPPGEHALHFHAVPKCEAPFTSAGGHFNPLNKKHGMQNPEGPHAGDLMNVTADDNGNATVDLHNANVILGEGDNSLADADGSALVLHADPDDYETDPSGNSGDRIACGVIEITP